MGFFAGDEVPDYFLAGSCSERASEPVEKKEKKTTTRDLFAPAFSISRENAMHECCGPDSASPVRFHTFEPQAGKKSCSFLSLLSLIHKGLGR